jgi:hypothetical protein
MANKKKEDILNEEETGGEAAASTAEGTGEEKREDTEQAKQTEEFPVPNPCVYCGPSVRGVARQFTTYQGGLPEEMKEFLRQHPAAKRLIVSTGKFSSTRERMEKAGTAEHLLYQKLKAELLKG